MLKFLLLFQIGVISTHCYHPIPDNPPSIWEPELFMSDFTEFTEDEQTGKTSLISREQFSKLKVKNGDLFLPRNVLPISYKLKIRPILESSNPEEVLTAPGSVEILVRCEAPTDSITLHAHTKEYVNIFEDSLRVERQQKENIGVSPNLTTNIGIIGHSVPKEEDDESNFYQIQLSEGLAPGEEYVLRMNFLTKISNNSLNGLYLSKYTDPVSKEQKFLAVTQFEAIDARRMFPSFDEPDLKSTFEIVISRASRYNSMSNMPIDFTEPDPEFPGYFLDHYRQSPAMSTYLVALVVSEFTCSTAPSFLFNKPVEACGPPHMVAEGGAIHAAQVSARILNFYEKLWDVSYPLPKMTSAAIPDFDAGAMENYGLNTYRLTALLYYPGKSSESRRQSIESTIAHELAHQNFGNLVTCKSWNQIFLNEGFATYVAKLGMEEVSPEFEGERFGWYTSYFQKALKFDAKSNTHPIVQSDEYLGLFDSISYDKGASVIKMMENILSQKTLINGLRHYLKTFSFANTHHQNLFETLDYQARADGTHPELASFVDIMESWTLQPGFPLVRVGQIFGQLFHISQEKFVQPISIKDKQSSKHWKLPLVKRSEQEEAVKEDNLSSSLWHCPIFITHSGSQSTKLAKGADNYEKIAHDHPTFWLTKEESIKAWNSDLAVNWIIVNPDAKAFVRVLYDAKLSGAIKNQLNKDHKVFSPITRAQLIDDGFECAWAGYNSVTVALDRTVYLLHETDSRVWSTVSSHFRQIHAMLSENPEDVANLNKYILPRVSRALEDVGVEQPPDARGLSVLHRSALLDIGARLKLPNVLSYAKRLVDQSMEDPELGLDVIPVDIRAEVLCAAVIEGSPAEFNFILEKYSETKDSDPSMRNLLLGAISCTRDSDIIQSLLQKSTDPEFIYSKTDSLNLLRKLAISKFSRSATFLHIQKHFKDLLNYFDGPRALSGYLLRTFSLYWNTEERLAQMTQLQNEFQEELKPAAESEKVNIALIKENIDWMARHGKAIKEWLQTQVKTELGN